MQLKALEELLAAADEARRALYTRGPSGNEVAWRLAAALGVFRKTFVEPLEDPRGERGTEVELILALSNARAGDGVEPSLVRLLVERAWDAGRRARPDEPHHKEQAEGASQEKGQDPQVAQGQAAGDRPQDVR